MREAGQADRRDRPSRRPEARQAEEDGGDRDGEGGGERLSGDPAPDEAEIEEADAPQGGDGEAVLRGRLLEERHDQRVPQRVKPEDEPSSSSVIPRGAPAPFVSVRTSTSGATASIDARIALAPSLRGGSVSGV